MPKEGTQQNLQQVLKELEELPTDVKTLVLLFSSSFSEIEPSLRIAKQIAFLRDTRKIHVTAYIDSILVGPMALIPFTADTIVTTNRVTWGMALKGQTIQNQELVRGIVSSYISADNPIRKDSYLRLLFLMTDMIETHNKDISQDGKLVTQHDLISYDGIEISKNTSSFTSGSVPGENGNTSLGQTDLISSESSFSKISLSNESTIGRIYIGPKSGMISQSTLIYVKAAFDHFIKTRPSCVILELDTPGGEVFAAEKIAEILKSLDVNYGIPVIAYINNWAISAGAMLAYSCRYIITEPDGTMGAATPVTMTDEGMKPTDEKMISALRADFANKAAFFGRNPLIAEAMVDPDLVLVERNGAIIKLSNDSDIQKQTFGESGDRIITTKGKLLTLTSGDMMDYGVAQIVLPKEVTRNLGDTSVQESFLIDCQYFTAYPRVPIETFEMDYKTRFVAFVSSPYITSMLVFALMVCIYLEISTPGIAVPGLVAAVSFFLLLVSSNAQESIMWFEPIVAIFGLMLIMFEIFVFPTMGFMFAIGILFMIGGTLLMIIPSLHEVFPLFSTSSSSDTLHYSFGALHALHLLSMISIAIVSAFLVIFYLLKYDIRPTFLSRFHLILDAVSPPPPQEYDQKLETGIRIGDEAITLSSLRPAGKIEKNGHIFDAMSTGEFIEKGEKVRVVEIRGNVISVETIM